MKKLAAGILFLGLASLVQAAPLAVQPKPGQWQISTQTFAEGKEVGAQLQLIKQQAAAFLKPAQRQKLDQYDPSQFNECLSPAKAKLLADPQKGLAVLGKALGQCELQLDSQTSTGMAFSGYCEASKQGIEGQVKGQVDYQSATQATGFVEGLGALPPPVQLLLIGRLQSQIQVRNQFTAQWQQTQCVAR